jgi:arsenate reductase (thioredoxin)
VSRAFRVLFLCTGNSARSQIAEALLTHLGGRRFEAASAGTEPAARVNPGAMEALAEAGIRWNGRPPRPVNGLEREHWDLVVTVCDDAREACPLFPAGPLVAHWGIPDPAAVEDNAARRWAFAETLRVLRRRIGRLVELPVEQLPRGELEVRIRELARDA